MTRGVKILPQRLKKGGLLCWTYMYTLQCTKCPPPGGLKLLDILESAHETHSIQYIGQILEGIQAVIGQSEPLK